MRRASCDWLILLCLCPGSLWAAFPGLRYLDEIGHLGTPEDPRTSVRLGRASAVSTQKGLSLQGRADNGKTWHATLPISQGVGFTNVWQADFDHNLRPDLLIAAHFPGSGRCANEVTLSFLLFNDHGEPVPWVMETYQPDGRTSPDLPALFGEVSPNRAAELVVTNCAYPGPPRNTTDWRITGIYEARNATWSLARPMSLGPYIDLVHRSYRFQPPFSRLLKTNPRDWLDQGNRLYPQERPPVRLVAARPRAKECNSTRLPPVVDGRLQMAGWKDPCVELGRDRLELSNGTFCYGWPTVVLDGEDGRQIVAGSEHPEPLLQKIIDKQRTVVLSGQRDTERCSPTLLWALRTR